MKNGKLLVVVFALLFGCMAAQGQGKDYLCAAGIVSWDQGIVPQNRAYVLRAEKDCADSYQRYLAEKQSPSKAAKKRTSAKRVEVDENGNPVPPKYTCITGASYTGVIWEEKYPYPTGRGFFAGEHAVVYRKYQPTPSEEAAATKDCQSAHQRYLTELGRWEQQMHSGSKAKATSKKGGRKNP